MTMTDTQPPQPGYRIRFAPTKPDGVTAGLAVVDVDICPNSRDPVKYPILVWAVDDAGSVMLAELTNEHAERLADALLTTVRDHRSRTTGEVR